MITDVVARTVPVAPALRAARAGRERDLADLVHWLSIPSVSADPRAGSHLLAAADHLAAALTRAGARVHRLPTGGPPVLVGDVPARRQGPAGGPRPVLLVYGHYDVQPAGAGWSGPAFRPRWRGGELLGRGANDDKGQLAAVVAALRAWRSAGGPACRVLVVAEGAEEIGSPGLRAALAAVGRWVRPDVVLACDTERAPDGVPAVALSQRGRIDADLVVDVGGVPSHPGRLGGSRADPSLVLVDVLHGLRSAVARIPAPAGSGWRSRPVLSVTRLDAGDQCRPESSIGLSIGPSLGSSIGPSIGPSIGAVPVRACARIDVRLPPGIAAQPAATGLADIVRPHRSDRVEVLLRPQNIYSGATFTPRPEILAALDQACRRTFGAPLRYAHSGGSLPAAVQLAEVFGMSPVLLGLGTPGGRAHGPDERLDLRGWTAGVDLLIHCMAIGVSNLSLQRGAGVSIRS